jgi:hypothetical protein
MEDPPDVTVGVDVLEVGADELPELPELPVLPELPMPLLPVLPELPDEEVPPPTVGVVAPEPEDPAPVLPAALPG